MCGLLLPKSASVAAVVIVACLLAYMIMLYCMHVLLNYTQTSHVALHS